MAARNGSRALVLRALGLWIALMVLLAVSIGGALWLSGPLALVVPLVVSVAMTGLVGVFFMDLPAADGLSRVSALAGLLFLAALFTFTFADELTRHHLPAGFDAPAE